MTSNPASDPMGALRFVRPPAGPVARRPGIRIATYNLHFAARLDRALSVIRAEPDLAEADVLALQEADEAAAHRIAEALGLGLVYYPACLHPRTGRNFGPALLTRWPVMEDCRLDLPHTGIHGMPRIAVAAVLELEPEPVSVYVVHFGTMREIFPRQQDEQARRVLADAATRPGPAIIAGDLNRRGVGRIIEQAGWRWITRRVGRTHLFWSFDHVFVRGFDGAPARAGSVRAALQASDHRAVWAEIRAA